MTAKEIQWTPLKDAQSLKKGRNYLLHFDTGEVRCLFEDNLPFAIVTHVILIPEMQSIIKCPSCGTDWNTQLYNACQCGASLKT